MMFEEEIRVLLSRCLVAGILLVPPCAAQLPDYYKTVNRVTWVVENIDRVGPAWEAMGLSEIREYSGLSVAEPAEHLCGLPEQTL
ncbi:MAG TPA: hypothetical protein VMS37_01875 [Verrucomicrobiae bacterium]|nr:hypothetical protein [Verrucomicrobiae bacterium]